MPTVRLGTSPGSLTSALRIGGIHQIHPLVFAHGAAALFCRVIKKYCVQKLALRRSVVRLTPLIVKDSARHFSEPKRFLRSATPHHIDGHCVPISPWTRRVKR